VRRSSSGSPTDTFTLISAETEEDESESPFLQERNAGKIMHMAKILSTMPLEKIC